MKILIDIGHPAHVHYFRNFIRIMKERGHKFVVVARKRDIVQELLTAYQVEFIDRGRGSNGVLGKLAYLPKADIRLIQISRKHKIDLFLSFGSPYSAHAAWLLKKPHIAFDDTEHAKWAHLLYMPFTDLICVPSCFKKIVRRNQVIFWGYMELSYLHPNYFSPDENILRMLGIRKSDRFSVLRFVAWKASHDLGHKGITFENKLRAVREFSQHGRVFVSSESPLPRELERYRLDIPPYLIHHILFFASLLFSEGATMASECAALGTPAIFHNNCRFGTLDEQENKYGLVFNFPESREAQESSIKKGLELLGTPHIKSEWQLRRRKMLDDKIDVTAFMVWLIENYPNSAALLKQDPKYSLRFRCPSRGASGQAIP